jgi:hypothetical protein
MYKYKWFTQTLDLHAMYIIANTYMHNIGNFLFHS